jgi:hypothetical protein
MTFPTSLAHLRTALWFAGLLVLIVLVEHTITLQPVFLQRPVLPLAVVFDLLVGMPVLFYFLVVRRYQWPLSTVATAVGAGLALVHWLIPAAQQPLRVLQWLPVVLEMTTLTMLAIKARRLAQAYQAAETTEVGFLPRARLALPQVLGPAGALLVAELDMLHYAVLGWGARPPLLVEGTAFSYHRESGFGAFIGMLAGVLTIETAALHLLVSHWGPHAAGWLLCLDVYSLLLVIAHGHAVRLSPSILTAEVMTLRVGFIWHLSVPRSTLVAIEPICDAPLPDAETLTLTKLLFTTPNLLLTFAAPVAVAGPYGIRRTARRLAVYLDQPQQFIVAAGLSSSPTAIPSSPN